MDELAVYKTLVAFASATITALLAGNVYQYFETRRLNTLLFGTQKKNSEDLHKLGNETNDAIREISEALK